MLFLDAVLLVKFSLLYDRPALDYSWNKMSSMQGDKALRSFNFGLFLTRHLNEQWHLNFEGLAKYKRGIDGMPVYDLRNDSLNLLFRDGQVRHEIKYLSLPITVQYVLPAGLFAELGPQISIRLKAKDVFSASLQEGGLSFERDTRDDIQRWDFGWLGGVGYKFTKSKLISVGMRYYGSFSDVQKNISGSQHHQQLAFYCNLPMGKATTKKPASTTSAN